ncbi:ERV46 (YAL042W) [Zygosaccharomyces parabailii]|uniref:Endoplasmic reticulum-Golgi intermediate compartment protein n=1 Tax=Zygosaccharomyces bailii (strain CLIB 213 / ATCC 58445 / CBS 680 / BCRC 21525 / NBRC 1098 / NCYC 1416 / NRRL Y-2227) TaxID=1333698 RepID=A0A8J2T8B4_ZYGB2|nr:ERV46 (YAL042W) [Zygosaccharomyces parabailii]CDF90626.1 ZYBA0S07-05402g1_1 [Zygosaccharomyces bailii CLIB 213]CDH15005.1 probable ER-derived vesicles protein ERV46 [Zygosaccharomyces bailii ISA1307]SJM84286.1 probable ER-derived vesicles protein ERV46 [Zygosaccharomyces bailii]
MLKRSTLRTFDAFAKTEEDVRIRTRSGGIIALSCCLVTIFLLVSEWLHFNEVVTRPELVVDKDRQLKLELVADITFPNMPCDMLSLDIMDSSGEVQLDTLESGFTKTRLDQNGQSLGSSQLEVSAEGPRPEDDDYCGPCYGARDQEKNAELPKEERVCCQTCNDVRRAYLEVNWAFFDGKNIEQCEREGYVQRVNEQLNEGCRVEGKALLNRIQGTFHFAPGAGFQNKKGHFHDLSLYEKTHNLNFNHIINHLSFGKPVTSSARGRGASVATAPLDGRQVFPDRDTHLHQFSYFTKIVPTRYEYLDKMVVETAQFSATYHDRPLVGGADSDHPTTVHTRGGFPGLFVLFEMSPLKVINREQHAQTWSGFLLNCITSVGGVLAVGTVLDKITYKAQKSIWGKKSA